MVAQPGEGGFAATARNFLHDDWAPTLRYPRFGFLPLLFATLLMTGIAILIAVPLGIACALYLSELVPTRLHEWLKPVIKLPASIPTVVLGYFGLMLIAPRLQGLHGVGISIPRRRVTALIGPSGCGKSTFLRSLNRLNDRIGNTRIEGAVRIDGEDPYARNTDLMKLRRKVGMVFQKPNLFPMSIFDNVALGPRMRFGTRGGELDETVRRALADAALWDEVKDEYRRKSALDLSGGQQQRLCVARMLTVKPEILLMDEPCSALDPISAAKIEALIEELAERHTVIVVTHNLQQATRISHFTAFFMAGELIEFAASEDLFMRPAKRETEDYIRGKFG